MSYPLALNIDNPATKGYLFYSSLLIGKTLLMSTFTARHRFQKLIFLNPEDAKTVKGAKVAFDDQDIERVRRAHLNDLENIPMFILAGGIYLATNPDPTVALTLFRCYTVFRFVHTFVYAIYVLPQPARALSWGAAYAINWYLIIKSAITFFTL